MNFSSAIKLASIATERNLSSTLRTTLDRSRSTRMDWTSSTDITVLASAHNARNKTRATIVETAVDAGFICSIYRCPHSVDDCICFTRSSKIHMQNTYIFGTVKHQLPSFFLSCLTVRTSLCQTLFERLLGVASAHLFICIPYLIGWNSKHEAVLFVTDWWL